MPLIQYSVSLFSVIIALLGTLQAPAIRSGTPFLFFFLAVTISAWYGGGWAGLFALGLALLSTAYWVLPPANSFQLTGWQLIQLTGFLAVAGAIIGLVVALQREKKRVNTQREALQLTLASIGDAVIVTDATGAVSWLNERAVTLTGWSATAAEGRPLPEIFTLIDEQTRVPVESPVKRVLAEGHSVALGNHIALVSKDGVVRTIEDSAAPIRDEQGIIQGVVLVFHDITERKRAELALRASEEKLTKIFNASPLIVTITRLADGRLIEVNDTFVRLTGYTRAESIGRTPVEIGLWVEPAQRDEGLARLRAGRFPANSEHLFRMKDGNVRTCLIAAELLNLNEETCVLTVLTDITDWKRAEEALRASEARFAKAFRASPQAMSITRAADGVYLDANESFARLVDYPLADIIGRTSFDVGIWRDAQRRQSVNQNILEQGSNRDFEHRFHTHKGELRDIVSAGVAIEVDGEACILSLANDVTARKQAEEALRESEARFRATFEQAAVGVAQVSADGHYLRVNQRLCEITGYAQAELVTKRDQEITHPADRAATQTQVEQLLAGALPSYTREQRYLRPDGAVLWVNLTESTVRDEQGALKYRVAIIEDISARKAAEARLVFLAEMSAVLSASLDYAATLERLATLMTPQLADLCTVELLEPAGTITPVAVVHVNPSKLTLAQQLRAQYPPRLSDPYGIGHVLQTGQAAFYPMIPEAQLLATASDESEKMLLQGIGFKSVLIVPLQARGQTLGALTLVWSETDRQYVEADLRLAEEVAERAALAVDNARLYQAARQAESELRQLNEHLEQRVSTRTTELERSNQELDQFAYVASHDLKAPLRAIDQLASWISEDSAALLPAASQEHLTKLRGRIRRMERLLDDLLTYSRAGRLHHPVESVATDELVRNVIDMLAPPSGFTIQLGGTWPSLVTERIPLETVLRNIIGNAIKHHDHPQTGHLAITATEQATLVEFTITDDGPGIDPQYHARIFQMFQTLKPRDQVEGSGMGLAVVKKLVDHYGGAIHVTSQLGAGATFRFTWPKAPLPETV